ncbi:MAG: O-antigen ligase family protein [Trueperaceae bacterium]
MRLPDMFLAGSAGIYVLAVLLASSQPGLSRVVHLSVAMMLLALLWKAAKSRVSLNADPLPWLFWVFFLFTFASILWSSQTMPATVRSVSLLFDVLGATLVWIALFNGLSLKWIAACAGVGAAVQAGVALFQFWTGSLERVEGLGGNSNELAIQLSLTAFLLLMVWRRSFLVGAAALSLIVIATVTSGSRKMVFVWLTYLLLLSRWLTMGVKRSTLIAAVALLMVPASVLVLINTRETWLAPIENLTVYQRLDRAIAGEDSSANLRGNLIEDAFEQWSYSPLWGHGVDQFRWLNPYRVYSHNNFTEVLANLGIVGLILFYSIHVNLLWRTTSQARAGSGRSWLVLAFVLMLLMMDLARVSYTDRYTWLLLSVVGFICHREGQSVAREEPLTGGARVTSPI